jgi:outer membrane protein assembly factor BamB
MIPKSAFHKLGLGLLALSSLTLAQAEDWPAWRGAQRDDISQEKGLLKAWPAEGPKLAWIFKNAGIGYSGPAIVDGKLYTMVAREDAEQVLCLNAETGEELWATEIGPVLQNNWGDGPRATPTVDGAMLYAMSAKGHLNCISLADHKVLWKTKMEDLGGKLPGWGYTESVLVDGPNLICTPGGSKGALAALDKKTGAVKWQSADLTKEAWYSSPVVATFHGKRQYIQLVHKTLAGIDATNGAVLWKTDWRGGVAVIPTPIISGNSVYITSGYNAGCKKVTIGADMSVTTDYDMEKDGIVNHHGGVILLDGKLYGHSDAGGWVCQNFADGKILWKESKLGKGAIGYADGKFYCVSESDGTVVLVDASADGWKETGRFKLSPQTDKRKKDGRIWTHPVIVNGKLYLRDQDLIYCFNIRA